MRKGHFAGCVIAIAIALALFAATGGSIGGLGLLLAVLICPVTMAAVLWLLMGSPHQRHTMHPLDTDRRADSIRSDQQRTPT